MSFFMYLHGGVDFGFFLLTETDDKANTDIGVSSTSSALNERSENDNKIVDHITNEDLKSLCIRNLNKIVVGTSEY